MTAIRYKKRKDGNIMGFFKKLLGLGLTAGAAYAAVKVTRKYQENKALEQVTSAAGEAPLKKEPGEIIGDVAKAATEVFQETGEKVKDTIFDVKEKMAKGDDCCCPEDTTEPEDVTEPVDEAAEEAEEEEAETVIEE